MTDRTTLRLGGVGMALLGALGTGCRGSTVEVGSELGGAAGAEDPGGPSGGASGATGSVPSGVGGSGTSADLDPVSGVKTTDKVDLLFVVDNSASMQDKQILLSQAVPVMLSRILNPPCVDPASRQVVQEPSGPAAACPEGTVRQVPPVQDMHIGVVSSSIGGHGHPTFCEGQPGEREGNDRAHLISPATRPGAGLVDDTGWGFLKWDTRPADDPEKTALPGENDLNVLVENLQKVITATGEVGCGFEAPLEAMYRFLVDPEPPESVVQQGDVTERQGIDRELLGQREHFLRPDSAVVIVVISDENDCSIQDSGYGWIAGNNQVSLGTSACDVDPNDKCCTYCGFATAPPGCPDIATDPKCQLPRDNAQNVRCWDQKRRFGLDFLYPTTRYIAGLRDAYICPDSSSPDADCRCRYAEKTGQACDPGTPVPNPLYQDLTGSGRPTRDRSLVTLVSIVGVPWPDLATEGTLNTVDTLEYRSGSGIDWDLVLGDPTSSVPPNDPLMVESTEPRTLLGPHPIIGVAPAPPDSSNPMANPINGHEWSPQNQEDLQYACIFDLAPIQPEGALRDCNVIAEQTCDCFDPTDDLAGVNLRRKPLCHGATGYSSVQVRAKAYPGLRHLDVVRGLENEGYAASICPKLLAGDPMEAGYGYNPAVLGWATKLERILE